MFYLLIRKQWNNQSDSRLFPSPYLFVLQTPDERLGRNDVKVAGQAGKERKKVISENFHDFRAAFP